MSARRRFYKTVSVTPERSVALDRKPIRTPKKELLVLPTEALACAVAAEWEAQGEKIRPTTMLLTKLANTAIDRVAAHRAKIVGEIVAYAGSDLVCYRAIGPAELQARQAAVWDPVLDFALTVLDARMEYVHGVTHRQQRPEALAAVQAYVEGLDDFAVAALFTLTTLTGSALLAAMIERRAVQPEAAWSAVHVDEDWQIDHWGQDAEAAKRRKSARAEFNAACRFLALI